MDSAEEAKRLLTYDSIDDVIISDVIEACEPWRGKLFSEFRLFEPKHAVASCLEKLIYKGIISKLDVTQDDEHRIVVVRYKKQNSDIFNTFTIEFN